MWFGIHAADAVHDVAAPQLTDFTDEAESETVLDQLMMQRIDPTFRSIL